VSTPIPIYCDTSTKPSGIRIQTEILYLPRTSAHYSRPFIPKSGNEKRPCISEDEWRRLPLQRDFGKGSKSRSDSVYQKEPELLLPRSLKLPSGEDVPFLLSLPTTPKVAPQVSIQLVRLSTVQTRAGAIQQAKMISEGRIHDPTEPGLNLGATIQGTLSTGEAEKDISWGFGTFLSVSVSINRTRS
jgi:hypothetical protein